MVESLNFLCCPTNEADRYSTEAADSAVLIGVVCGFLGVVSGLWKGVNIREKLHHRFHRVYWGLGTVLNLSS